MVQQVCRLRYSDFFKVSDSGICKCENFRTSALRERGLKLLAAAWFMSLSQLTVSYCWRRDLASLLYRSETDKEPKIPFARSSFKTLLVVVMGQLRQVPNDYFAIISAEA